MSENKQSIVVFGGSGFVGSLICELAVKRGIQVTSVSRTGVRPPHVPSGGWADQVQWEKGDALDAATYKHHLAGAGAVITTVGSPPVPFVDYKLQFKMNGDCNCAVAAAAREADVPNFVLVNAKMPAWLKSVAEGYYDGKKASEKAANDFVEGRSQASAAVLQPPLIYGTRHAGRTPIPLGIVFYPVSLVMQQMPGILSSVRSAAPGVFEGFLHAPVSAHQVATAALQHAMEPAAKGQCTKVSAEDLLAVQATS